MPQMLIQSLVFIMADKKLLGVPKYFLTHPNPEVFKNGFDEVFKNGQRCPERCFTLGCNT